METLPELLAWIERDPGLSHLLAEAGGRLLDDPGHDTGHCLRVTLWTLRLLEGEIDAREAIAAALLHDVVNLPKDSPDRAQASVKSAELAEQLLPQAQFDHGAVTRIAEAIRDHSYSRGKTPSSPLGRALQDADRLEALGALGIFRTATCGAKMGASYLHREDPWAKRRPLDDKRYTVDHFFEKLLRLTETMNTERGRAEAQRRTEFMRTFLTQLGTEIGEPPPG
jgi:uncharacterized protein